MIKRDGEQEAERPRYYSQFWLDVAAGRKVIGVSQTEEDEAVTISRPPALQGSANTVEDDEEELDNAEIATNGFHETDSSPLIAPMPVDEELIIPNLDDVDLLNEEVDLELTSVEDVNIPDAEVTSDEEEGEYYDEDEDNTEWSGGQGRKKFKPGRPKPAKHTKREPGHGL